MTRKSILAWHHTYFISWLLAYCYVKNHTHIYTLNIYIYTSNKISIKYKHYYFLKKEWNRFVKSFYIPPEIRNNDVYFIDDISSVQT